MSRLDQGESNLATLSVDTNQRLSRGDAVLVGNGTIIDDKQGCVGIITEEVSMDMDVGVGDVDMGCAQANLKWLV